MRDPLTVSFITAILFDVGHVRGVPSTGDPLCPGAIEGPSGIRRTETMRVGIVVLTYNNYADTRECIDTLQGLTYEDHEIIVVDNASTDGSIERLRGELPQCVFVCNDKNLGYAGGNNRGIEAALERGAELVWILNNDTIVDKDALGWLVKEAVVSPKAGIIGSKVYYFKDKNRLFFAGGTINRWTGETRHVGYMEIDRGQYDSRSSVDYINGCNMLVRKECLEDVGALDEAYFLYFEETDLAVRAKRAGWEVVFIPAPGVWHKIEEGAGWVSEATSYYLTRNHLYFVWKNYRPYFPTALLYSLATNIVFCITRGSRGRARMCWKGYRDFFRGSMGALA